MASLADLSRDLAEVVERCAPGLVRVAARRGGPASGVVWAENLVLTANHAVEQEDRIEVSTGSAAVGATLAGRDPGTDLALLRTTGLAASPLPRGKASELRVGHLVLAIGRPNRLQVSVGIVSALGGSFRSWRGGDIDGLIQTSAELRPGFSGGPLLDSEGRIVGFNSWNYGRGGTHALPVETAETVAESLARHGRVRRAYLGIGTQPVRLAAATASHAGQELGLLVVTVDPAGPGAESGVMQGDVILGLDASAIRQLDDLFQALRRLDVDAACRLRLVRGGEVRELAVRAGELPA